MRGALLVILLLVPAAALAQEGGDPDAVVCRPGQQQTFSRIPGPKVCMTARQWDALKKKGLDVSSDGRGTVASEKERNLNRPACNTGNDGCF